MTLFYDSTRPELIPDTAEYAVLYGDGTYAVKDNTKVRRFKHRRWITVAGEGEHCGIADYEPGNPVYEIPGQLHAWAVKRLAYAGTPPIVYSDMSDLHGALTELGRVPRLYWIATRGHGDISIQELLALISADYGIDLPESSIWGHQYEDVNGEYDTSRLFGRWYL